MQISKKKVFLVNISGVNEINFIPTTNIEEEELSSWNLALAIIPTANNSQTKVRNVLKICF